MNIPDSPEALFEDLGSRFLKDSDLSKLHPLSQKVARAVFTSLVKGELNDLAFLESMVTLAMIWRDLNGNNGHTMINEFRKSRLKPDLEDIASLIVSSRIDQQLSGILLQLSIIPQMFKEANMDGDDAPYYSFTDD